MWRIFPPKDLDKYGAQNTHAPFLFFFFLPINWALIYLLSLIIPISEEVNKQSFIVCIVFQQYLLNKPQKFRVPQSILFASN